VKLLFEKWKKFIAEDTASLSSMIDVPKVKISYNSTFLSPFKHIQQGGYTIEQFYKDLEAEFGADWEKKLLPGQGADRKFGPEHFDALTQLAQKTQRSDLLSLINKTPQKYTQRTSSGTDSSTRQAGSAPIQLGDARIAAVGDSITKGVGAGGASYIDILGGSKHAIGGKASFNLFGMVDQALATKPDYVIIFVGINNPMAGNRYGACSGNWERLLKNNISEMYATVRAAGAKVIGVTLLPAMGRSARKPQAWESHYIKCNKNPNRRGCCKGKRREARNPQKLFKGTLDVNAFIMANADIPIDTSDMFSHRGILPAYNADGIHLNRNGQQQLANKIAAAIG